MGYVGFFHLGWADGFLLRYSGEYYDKLSKSRFRSQIRLYILSQAVFGLSICFLACLFADIEDRLYVYIFTGIAVLTVNSRVFFQYILQATSRIREYAIMTIVERVVYIAFVTLNISINVISFIPYIIANSLGTLCALIYGMWCCRDILRASPELVKFTMVEVKASLSTGYKILIANFAGILIIGVVRQAVEIQWDVETFGKISLILSISNMFMVLISAISVVLFPMLRRVDNGELVPMYTRIRNFLMLILLCILIFYYPVRVILTTWLPQYVDSLRYLAILFPVCLYESKMSLLINTYLKNLRKEKTIMVINIVTLLLSLVVTAITAFGFHNLDMAMVSIVLILAFRCIFAELLLSKYIDIHVKSDIMVELIMTVIFICASWFVGGLAGLLLYFIAYYIYVYWKRNEVKNIISKPLGTILS